MTVLPIWQVFATTIFAYLAIGIGLPMGQNGNMPENRIRELRTARKLTLGQLAEKVGLDMSYVQRLEKGARNLSVKHFPKFAKALGVEPHELVVGGEEKDSGESNNLKLQSSPDETILPLGNYLANNYRLGPATNFKQSAVPIRGRAMAGKEGTLQFSSDDIVGWADAPEKLANLPGAYAVYVIGDSMIPVLENGFICHVNPNLPPARGLAVIQVSSDDGVTVEGFVKHLVSVTDRFVKVCQYNPEKTIMFPRKHVLAIHRIVLSGPPY